MSDKTTSNICIPALDDSREANSRRANVLLVRQPICATESLRTRGYEVLMEYVGSEPHRKPFETPSLATLLNALVDIGIETIVGDQVAFISVRLDEAIDDFVSLIPPTGVVLQVDVLEDPTPTAAETMQKLRKSGYRFALKNFRYRPCLDALLPFTHSVKLNVKGLNLDDIMHERQMLKSYSLQYIAVGVDSSDDVEVAMRGRFDLMQGYFFCKPRSYEHTPPGNNRLNVLRLMARLRDPGVGPRELGRIIEEDLALSYRLLRFVNSAMNGLSKRVDSVRHAATMVGNERIRSWATVMAFSRIDDKPMELLMISLLRAKLAEHIAESLGLPNRDAFFTTGLFSTLDAFLDCPMEEALSRLPLSDEVSAALLTHSGLMGQTLESILEYEQGNWFSIVRRLNSPDAVQHAYLHALDWVRQSMGEISH